MHNINSLSPKEHLTKEPSSLETVALQRVTEISEKIRTNSARFSENFQKNIEAFHTKLTNFSGNSLPKTLSDTLTNIEQNISQEHVSRRKIAEILSWQSISQEKILEIFHS